MESYRIKGIFIICKDQLSWKVFWNQKNIYIFFTIPANICWSWRRLEYVLEDGKLLQDVFKTSSTHVFKASSLRHAFKTSLRRLGDKKWGYLYLTNLSGCVSNKSIFHKSISDESKAHPKSLIRTQWFQYSSYFEIQAEFLFWELKSLMTVWCCEISWIQIRHWGEAIKTTF